jgi:hypothetical protein
MSSPVPWADARAKITAANLGVPIEWPNEDFQEPVSSPGLWISVETCSDSMEPIEVGANVWQESGTLYIHVMAPQGSGTMAARTLAKQIVTLFRSLPPPQTVVYTSAGLGTGAGNDPRGLWWVLPVSIDWRYQDITTG